MAGLAAMPVAADAQEAVTTPLIVMTARSVAPDGGFRGSAGGSDDFIVGQSKMHYLFAGNVARGSTMCGTGAAEDGVKPLGLLVAEYEHVWQISTTPIREAEGRFVFELDWRRYSHAGGTTPVASARHELALAEGQRHVLDLLHAPAGAACASVVLDVEVRFRERAAFADEAIEYDVWLVHTDPVGRKRTQQVSLTGLHGRKMPFHFPSLRFETPRLAADQYDFEVVSRVAGEIRGRLSPDGMIAIELSTTRRDSLERRGSDSVAMTPGGAGRKVLSLKPGEAVEIEIPSRAGMMSSLRSAEAAQQARSSNLTMGVRGGRDTGASAPAAAQPALVSGSRYVINFRPFFEGHRVTLLVQARRVQ